jgi:hypothetical protein
MQAPAQETTDLDARFKLETMRVVYLVLGVFLLINFGAACRTPPIAAPGCELVAGGLVHCPPRSAGNDERG